MGHFVGPTRRCVVGTLYGAPAGGRSAWVRDPRCEPEEAEAEGEEGSPAEGETEG